MSYLRLSGHRQKFFLVPSGRAVHPILSTMAGAQDQMSPPSTRCLGLQSKSAFAPVAVALLDRGIAESNALLNCNT